MSDNVEKKIILSVETDTSNAAQGIDDLKGKLNELNSIGITPFKDFKKTIQDATEEAVRLKQQFGENSKEFQEAANKLSQLKTVAVQSLGTVTSQLQEANKEAAQMGKLYGDNSQQFQKAATSVAALNQEMEGYAKLLDKIDPEQIVVSIKADVENIPQTVAHALDDIKVDDVLIPFLPDTSAIENVDIPTPDPIPLDVIPQVDTVDLPTIDPIPLDIIPQVDAVDLPTFDPIPLDIVPQVDPVDLPDVPPIQVDVTVGDVPEIDIPQPDPVVVDVSTDLSGVEDIDIPTPDPIVVPVSTDTSGIEDIDIPVPDAIVIPVSTDTSGVEDIDIPTPDPIVIPVSTDTSGIEDIDVPTPDPIIIPVSTDMTGVEDIDIPVPDPIVVPVSTDTSGVQEIDIPTPDPIVVPVSVDTSGVEDIDIPVPDPIVVPVSTDTSGIQEIDIPTPDPIIIPVSTDLSGVEDINIPTPDPIVVPVSTDMSGVEDISIPTPDPIVIPVSTDTSGIEDITVPQPDPIVVDVTADTSDVSNIDIPQPDPIVVDVDADLNANTLMVFADFKTTVQEITEEAIRLKQTVGENSKEFQQVANQLTGLKGVAESSLGEVVDQLQQANSEAERLGGLYGDTSIEFNKAALSVAALNQEMEGFTRFLDTIDTQDIVVNIKADVPDVAQMVSDALDQIQVDDVLIPFLPDTSAIENIDVPQPDDVVVPVHVDTSEVGTIDIPQPDDVEVKVTPDTSEFDVPEPDPVDVEVKADTAQFSVDITKLKNDLKGVGDVRTQGLEDLKNAIREASLETVRLKNEFGENSKGFAEASERLKELKDIAKDSVGSLKTALKEANVEAQVTKNIFGENSVEFRRAAQNVAELKDEFDEYKKTVEAFNPDNKFQGLVSAAKGAVGAVQGVAGAMALIGVQSDEVGKTVVKLQALMTFGDFLNSLDDIKNSWKNFNAVIAESSVLKKADAVVTNLASGAMRILGISTTATGTAFKALKVAIAATGIGLLVVTISTLLPIISSWISGTEDAEEAQKKLAKAIEEVNAATERGVKKLDAITKQELLEAKAAGATKEELRNIEIQGIDRTIAKRKEGLENYKKQIRGKKFTDEEALKHEEEIQKKKDEIADLERSRTIQELTYIVEDNDERKKLDKEKADKAKAAGEKALAQHKAAMEKEKALRKTELAELKKHLETIDKITDESQKRVALSKLSEKGKELFEIDDSFKKNLKDVGDAYTASIKILDAQLKRGVISNEKYNEDVKKLLKERNEAEVTLTEEKGIKVMEVEKKFNDMLTKLIADQRESSFQRERREINEKYDTLIEDAKKRARELNLPDNTPEVQQLTTLKDEKISQVTSKEETTKRLLQTETKQIVTKVENRILETDTPEERRKKLEALYKVDQEVKQAAHEKEMAQLGLNLQEIEKVEKIYADGKVDFEEEYFLLELERKGIQLGELRKLNAEYQAQVTEDDRQHSEERKKINDEERQAYMDAFLKIGEASKALGELFDEQTTANKVLTGVNKGINVANATMNTYKGITEIWAAKSVLPEPIGTAQKVASTIIAATSGFKAVKQILATPVPGGGSGGGGSVNPPSVEQVTAPIINAIQTQAATQVQGDVRITNPTNQVVKAFIVDRDLKDADEKNAFLNKISSI